MADLPSGAIAALGGRFRFNWMDLVTHRLVRNKQRFQPPPAELSVSLLRMVVLRLEWFALLLCRQCASLRREHLLAAFVEWSFVVTTVMRAAIRHTRRIADATPGPIEA
jgi:hypothetical protein